MVVLWGLSWPVMKVCVGVAPPMWLAAIRFASSGACLFGYLASRGQLRLPPRADLPIVASIGGLQMMAFTALGMIAMKHTDAGRAALLAYTTPLWGVIINWMIMRQTQTRRQFAPLAVGMTGIAIICSPWEMDWRSHDVLMGNALLLCAAICWSIVIWHVRHHKWTARPIDLAPWQMLLATVPLSIMAFAFEGSPCSFAWTPKLALMLTFFGPIATSTCFVISSEVGRRVTPFAMSNVTLGVPVIGIAASALLLGERITVPLAIGLVLIIAGVACAAGAARSANGPTK
jgi:drug/metabolite transporter (DMT)-like permease